MTINPRSFILAGVLLALALAVANALAGSFERQWIYTSESSAVIYWQLGDISQEAVSQVEYGTSEELGQSTEMTARARWSHLHQLTGLIPDATYYYRMVVVDTLTGMRTESGMLSFQTDYKEDAVRVPGNLAGPPYILDQPDTYYLLTQDIAADGNALLIEADSVTLDLDGHTVTFGNDTDDQVFGVRFVYHGQAALCNGRIVQGEHSGLYSCAVRSSSRPEPTEVFGISTDVHIMCAYPLNFLSSAAHAHIHHNHFYSRVIDLESRHYPGNALLQLGITGGDVEVNDNLLTEGCHRGIALTGTGTMNVVVHHNDIQHHQQYVNGYALISCENAEFHHNRVTSTGRGVHLKDPGVLFHDNYIATSAHQHRDDLPANNPPGTNPYFDMNLIEAHGIKFEGSNAKNCKVYDNYVRIVQRLPVDSGGRGLPEDKVDNGVYINSVPTSSSGTGLTDDTMNWIKDRWRYYYLRYSDGLDPAYIGANDATTLTAYLYGAAGPDYTIYMKWQYVPPTPLNIACYDPAANNEVYGNTFIGITKYETKDIWHGDYGDTGNWATGIMFVSMDKGPAPQGQYSIYVHDNTFISNDLFMNSYTDVNMTVRVENNTFELVGAPNITGRTSRFRDLGTTLENAVNAGNNSISTDAFEKNNDINADGSVNVGDVLALLLLYRTQPDNPLCDWNVDGTADMEDILVMLKDMSAAHRDQNETMAAAVPQVAETPSPYSRELLARLVAEGRDGL